MKAKDVSAFSLFKAFIGKPAFIGLVIVAMILFGGFVLHRWDKEWWFVPLLIGLGAYLFGFGIWWMIKNHKYLKFQSFVGWLMVAAIPLSIVALLIGVDLIITSIQNHWEWIVYYFEYIIFALITNAPVFAPVFIMLGLIFFVIYHIINIRRRAV